MAEQFIEQIAALVKKHAYRYGIAVHSPIVAQAILESARGKSELAVNALNYFGLKYKAGRCPTASGTYTKIGSEQNADGTYNTSVMIWCKFKSMEDCVIGYFDFISNARYANLKGVTDPETYLKNIKEDGYATSLDYVQNLMEVIERYNLTQYDERKEEEVAKIIAIDAGHGRNTAGKRVTLKGYPDTREWTLNDRIADLLEKLLADYDCKVVRVDDTTGANDISLSNRVGKANSAKADIYISIHHNAGIKGGAGGGTVVYYYSSNIQRRDQAQKLYNFITDETRLYGNRSQQVLKNAFYVLKNTRMPAFLIENGFMDSTTDVPIILSAAHAEKTAEGLRAFIVQELGLAKKKPTEKPTEAQDGTLYCVQVGAYSAKSNAEAMQKKLKAAGFDAVIATK